MKIYGSLLIMILLFSCLGNLEGNYDKEGINRSNRVVNQEFQSIIDSAKVEGSVLIYDSQKDVYYSNNFLWANIGKLPASTFKIPHSIIALETGVVEEENSIQKWDGKKKFIKAWEQDLPFKKAFRLSCVPCYQAIARKIGEERMNNHLARLKFGDMRVDSSNIDVFWLQGDSRITQFQQIDFLKRFQGSKLPISERTEKILKGIMVL